VTTEYYRQRAGLVLTVSAADFPSRRQISRAL
jgi:hypothetical protein